VKTHVVVVGTKIIYAGNLAEVTAWLASDKLQIKNSNNEFVIITPDEIEYVIDQKLLELPLNQTSIDLADYSPQQVADAQLKHEIISSYIDGYPSKPCIGEIAKKLNYSTSYTYKLVRKFTRESFSSLIREKRGRKPGTKRLQNSVENIIDEAINTSKGAGASLKNIVFKVRAMCDKADYPIPANKTISVRLRQRSAKENTRRTHGTKKANQDYAVRGGKHLTSHPLEMIQIDHCIVDVIIVDSTARKPIGRPWLTVAIDVHTRSILGFYLTLDHPSAVSNAACMVHAVVPKNRWLTDLGLSNIEYPMYGVPQRIHVDNGKDFRSAAFIAGCAEYGIKLTWRPPGAPHYGGHIERYIGTLMRSMRGLPGATLSSVADKVRYSNLEQPGMTFHEIRDWIIEQIGIYHGTVHSELKCSPLFKWENSLKDESGKITPPASIVDAKKLFIDFLPYKRGSIQRGGIQINTIQYYSAALKRFEIKTRCLIKYNPLSTRKIWVKPDGECNYIECDYSDIRLPDCSLAEFKLTRKALQSESNARIQNVKIFEAIERNRQRVTTATATTSKARRNQEKQKRRLPFSHTEPLEREASRIDYSRQPITYDVE
jgi:putative transposase